MDIPYDERFLKGLVVSKSDAYEDLFCSVITIFKTFQKKGGCLYGSIPDEHIKTSYNSSRKMLQTTVNLIYQGYSDPVFSFAIEFEFNRVVAFSSSITEQELCEIVLTKELIRYIRANDSDSIYDLLTYVCTGDVRNRLVPNANWVDS